MATYESLDEMLSQGGEGADIIDICSPPGLHYDQARAAILAGTHVFCEKPVVARVSELEDLRLLAGAGRRHLLAGHNYCFSPGIRRLAELVKAGAAGTARRVEIDVFRTAHAPGTVEWRPDWRREGALAGGGILMDHGPHTLSVALWLAGRPLLEISAWLTCAPGNGTEEAATLALAFDGLEVQIRLTWMAAERRTEYRVIGADGELALYDYSTLVVRQAGRESRFETFAQEGPHLWTQAMLASHARRLSDGNAEGAGAGLWQVTEALELACTSGRQNGRPQALAHSGGTCAV